MGFVIEIRSDPRLNLEVQMVSRQHPRPSSAEPAQCTAHAPPSPQHQHHSPYLSPGGNCETRLAWTHTHRDDMENEDWNA